MSTVVPCCLQPLIDVYHWDNKRSTLVPLQDITKLGETGGCHKSNDVATPADSWAGAATEVLGCRAAFGRLSHWHCQTR